MDLRHYNDADEGKGGGLGAFLPKVSSRLWPKEQKDQVGLILGLVSPLLLFLIEIFAVLPYYQKTESLSIHVVWLPMTFFLINYYGNLYKFIATDPNGGRQDLPIMQKQDFKYCATCGLNCPPRSYHCPTCNRCIWKRDHHASLGGVCAGYFNHRYYFYISFHTFFGLLHIILVSCPYFVTNLGELRPLNYWQLFVPHMALLMQFISIYQFLITAWFGCILGLFSLSCYFLGGQLFCIYHGQTRMEYLLGVKLYSATPYETFKEAVGQRWLLSMLFFAFPHKLYGDGIQYHKNITQSYENVKSL